MWRALLPALLSFTAVRSFAEAPIVTGHPWPATDALGRSLPVAAGLRPGRSVGMFYFLWHNSPSDQPAKDLSKILPQDPDLLRKPDSPLWGGPGSFYWGQPLYGFYHAMDPWVLRRHARLLSQAGIDTVIFDTTNRVTYREVWQQLGEVWSQIRREGGRTPQFCFMVNTRAGETAQELYRDLYQPGRFRELWFQWQGKPLLICDPAAAAPELAAFFTLRKAHWPFTLVNTHQEWHWESTFPQVYSYDQDSARPEEVNVAVAQNLRAADGKVTNMSEGNARGRSFHAGQRDLSPGAVDQGFNFQEQWERALQLDPPFVMVTGWNEWIAGRFQRDGKVVFVDQFDQEYSRDIEPVTGLHGDNYYYQLVANVRRYKGALPLPAPSPAKTIDLQGGFAPWQEVEPAFADAIGDNEVRDFGQGARHYASAGGRNDLELMKVVRDETHLCFYAKTRQPLTPRTDPNWMLLLIDADQNPKTGWEGYDFLLNRTIEGDSCWLERNRGGWNWEKVAKVPLVVQGNELMLQIPRAALGLPAGDAVSIDFKWWDSAQHPEEIMDSYLSGDVAPEGRFRFRYQAAKSLP